MSIRFVFIILFSIAIGLVNDLKGQSFNKILIGTWKGIKQDLRNGETGEKYTLDGKPYSTDEVLKFLPEGKGDDLTNKMSFVYSLNGKILTIGDRQYYIDKLTKTELILIEYSENDPENPMAFRTFYTRVYK
jgi:hypothetical protein